METIVCEHKVQCGRSKESDWPVNVHMSHRSRCVWVPECRDIFFFLWSRHAFPFQVGDTGYKTKGERC